MNYQMLIAPPAAETLSSYYRSYSKYISEDDLLEALSNATAEIEGFLKLIPKDKEEFRYDEGKWMLKEVIGHLVDTERIMSYRALRIARNDKTPLAGFEENDYVKSSNFYKRNLNSIGVEFLLVRESTIALFTSFEEEDFDKYGTANENPVSVRAILYMIIGHQRHHFNVIKERYL
jgi:hypothetical protein